MIILLLVSPAAEGRHNITSNGEQSSPSHFHADIVQTKHI